MNSIDMRRCPRVACRRRETRALGLGVKRRDLIRHREAHGYPLKRDDGSHFIYWNPAAGRREPVFRRSETSELLVREICQTLEIPDP